MLFKKLLRTMGQYKAQFISMIIMIALGFGVFVGANMEWVSIEKNTSRLFEETGLADYKIYSSSAKTGGVTATFSENDLRKIKELDGVKDAARFFSVNADVTLVNGEKIKTEKDGTGKDKIPRAAITVTESESVSFFNVTNGEAYDVASEDKIWVSDKFAEEKEIKVGDTLTFGAVQGVSEPLEFKVAGLIKSGEYMVCVQDSTQLMPDYKMFGYAYITPAAYKKNLRIRGASFAVIRADQRPRKRLRRVYETEIFRSGKRRARQNDVYLVQRRKLVLRFSARRSRRRADDGRGAARAVPCHRGAYHDHHDAPYRGERKNADRHAESARL